MNTHRHFPVLSGPVLSKARQALLLVLLIPFLLVLGLPHAGALAATPTLVSDQVAVTRSGLRLNRTTNTFDTTVSLKNTSSVTIAAPISLAILRISQPSVTLANPAGTLPDGTPYVAVPGSLAPGQTVGPIVLKFRNPNRVSFTYGTEVYGVLPNQPPVAHAGFDQTGAVGQELELNGSASTDADGDSLSYLWTLSASPDDSQAGLSNPTAIRPHLILDQLGIYRIQLVVNDGQANSLPDSVEINTFNSKPVAVPQWNEVPLFAGSTVELDGSASHDVDGDPLSYLWTLRSFPAGNDSQIVDPTGVAPTLELKQPGQYTVELVVNDSHANSDSVSLAFSTGNNPPVANAGVDQTALKDQPVTLDGRLSRDVENDPLSFAWSLTKPAGSQATLTDADQPICSFVPDQPGDYVAQLIVRDPLVAGAPDTALITVTVPPANQAPHIGSNPVTAATVGQAYRYDADATDNDGDPLAWSLDLAPAGMTIDPSSGLIAWTPDTAGTVDVTVKVTDGKGGNDQQAFTLTVAAARVNVPDVVGQSQALATTNLTNAGLVVGTVTETSSETAPAGDVISQDPAATTQVAAGTAVALVVSTGPAGGGTGLPPDPVTVAPAIDPTVATTVIAATEFLYTGGDPIQTGVAAGTIEARRAAVIRGIVLKKDGSPLPGVTLSILGHPEFGQTLSRADGMFDLAVNGGGVLTVNYVKAGYLPAQRQVNAPWQDYVYADDVVLIQPDARLSTVDLTNTAEAFHVAQGSVITDQDGTRQATLLIPQGTQAQVYNPDGTTRSVTSLHLRLTEYTVGDNGPESMPAPLPPTSAYTYAFEMKADEAELKIAGKDVLFDRPVPFYINNFLNFPVGTAVPVGYYDKDKAAWIPSDNGRVIKILTVDSGNAEIDSDGDGLADDATTLAALGITDAERQQLAGLNTAGQTLWRVQVSHLSTWDCNWPYTMPNDAVQPANKRANGDSRTKLDCATEESNSIIECENQILRELLPITGSGFALSYASDRVKGRKFANTLVIPLSGSQLPTSLKRIDLSIEVAGRRFDQNFPPQTNQSYTFEWDGLDAFGRAISGSQPASIRIGYAYDPVYASPAEISAAFAQFSGVPLEGSRARNEVRIFQDQIASVGALDARSQAVAGWSLSFHHRYDPIARVIYQGNGTRRSAESIVSSGAITTTVAGTASGVLGGFGGDGGPALQAALQSPRRATVAADGSLYFADGFNQRIRRIGSDGIIRTVVGTGFSGFSGDGGRAMEASLSFPWDVALAADGSIYVADTRNNRIRRVGPDGVIKTVAGNGERGFTGDGGPAIQATIDNPTAIALGSDGSLYIVDSGNRRVRRLAPDGIINTVAGGGDAIFPPFINPEPATQAALIAPIDIDLAIDGTLYILDAASVHRVGLDGLITTVAGTGVFGFSGDGGLATQAKLGGGAGGLALSNNGSIYIADLGNRRVRQVAPNGIIGTIAGTGTREIACTGDGGGGPSAQARLNNPADVAIAADGTLYIVDNGNHCIYSVRPSFPGVAPGDNLVPSSDSSVIYRFDASGRHLSTINAPTDGVLLTFAYDAYGSLTAITEMTSIDGDNLVTTIERDANGKPTAIIAPFGQRTTLALDANGYLAKVTNPAGEAYDMTYTADGLLTSFKDPLNHTSTFAYDALGRLLTDTNAESGSLSLSRNELDDGHSVTVRTGLNRITTHTVQNLATGDRQRTHLQPDNTTSTSLEKTDGTTTTTQADGTLATLVQGPDPRFSMLAPIAKTYSLATGGRTLNLSTNRTVTLTTPGDPLNLAALTDTLTLNGRTSTLAYDQAAKTFTSTSAANRQSTALIDNLGRTLRTTLTGILPVANTYDPQGRPATVSQGSGADERQVQFEYNPQGYLARVTDPLGREVSYQYDLAGRVTTQTLPDGRQIQFGYDAKGNLISLTPPGKPAHGFTYSGIDQTLSYVPPPVPGGGSNLTAYEYDLDKALTRITRPDGQTLNFSYDSAGRLSVLTTPEGGTSYGYDVTTGKLTGIAAPGNENLAYTHNGALLTQTAWSGTVDGSVGYTYDNDFRLASVSVNGANPFTYQYDNDSLLTSMGSSALGITYTLARNAQNGLLTGTTLGGVTDSYTYNGFAEMTGYLAKHGAADLFQTAYTRDKLGRITRKVETLGGATHTYDYTYDLAGRLIEVKQDNVVQETYGYDDNGNRTHLNGAEIAHYDAQDRLLDYNGATYTYTANGELSGKQAGANSFAYRYDVLGNLREATLQGGTHIEYVIDGQNRRIGKKRNGVLEQGFLYQSQLRPIAELDGSGNIVSRFIYGIGVNVPDFMIKGGVTYRLIKDHLGSPRLVVNAATNTVAQRLDYDAWGNVLLDSNPGFQPFGFAGGIYDRDTGWVRFGARDYDAGVGRWAVKDLVRFASGGSNLYVYSVSDPVSYVDNNGLQSTNFDSEFQKLAESRNRVAALEQLLTTETQTLNRLRASVNTLKQRQSVEALAQYVGFLSDIRDAGNPGNRYKATPKSP